MEILKNKYKKIGCPLTTDFSFIMMPEIGYCTTCYKIHLLQEVPRDFPAPVSYTHLDVYKRQMLGNFDNSPMKSTLSSTKILH